MDTLKMYIGSYTAEPGNNGISIFEFDSKNGDAAFIKQAAPLQNPSYLHLAGNNCLYAAMEEIKSGSKRNSGVAAFRINDNSGELIFINQLVLDDMGACHLATDKSCRFLAVANYTEGNVSLMSLEADGGIGSLLDTVYHLVQDKTSIDNSLAGSYKANSVCFSYGDLGPRADRQEKPHVHYVSFSEQSNELFVTDLSLDMILCYKIMPDTYKLVYDKSRSFSVKPGGGPRHFVVGGRYMYVINELSSDVSVFEDVDGSFCLRQNISTLPEGFNGENTASAIHFSDDNNYLYCSNRGHDSIAVFSIGSISSEAIPSDPNSFGTGLLTLKGVYPTLGNNPRDFRPAPGTQYIVAANQSSDSLVILKILKDGSLTPTGVSCAISQPTCVAFGRC